LQISFAAVALGSPGLVGQIVHNWRFILVIHSELHVYGTVSINPGFGNSSFGYPLHHLILFVSIPLIITYSLDFLLVPKRDSFPFSFSPFLFSFPLSLHPETQAGIPGIVTRAFKEAVFRLWNYYW
jgi:hypothetical protein